MIGLITRISYEFFLESHCWVHQDFLACSVLCLFAFCSLGQVWSGRSIGRFCLLEYWCPRCAGFDLGAECDRPVCPSADGVGGDCAVSGGFPFDSRASVVIGLDRAASDPRSGAWLCERRFAGGLFALG